MKIVDSGEFVTVRWTGHGVHANDMIGVPASGREIHVDALSLLRIEDGKIAEHWCVWDTAGLLQQIGAVPLPSFGGIVTTSRPGLPAVRRA